MLSLMKEEHDEGFDAFKTAFGDYDFEREAIEDEYYEVLYNVPGFVKNKVIYYPDENGNPDYNETPEAELWLFFSEDMTEFYRMAKKICRLKSIEYKDADSPFLKMDRYLTSRLVDNYDGMCWDIKTGTRHKYASCIEIWLGCDYYTDPLKLTIVLSSIMQNYSRKLAELKAEYEILILKRQRRNAMRKEYEKNKKIAIYGNTKEISAAEAVLDTITGLESQMLGRRLLNEGEIRLKIQDAIDTYKLKAHILVDGNTIYPYQKIIKQYEQLKKSSKLEKMTNDFYNFLHTNFDIAHYDKNGYIAHYGNDFSAMKTVLDNATTPNWHTDVQRILDYVKGSKAECLSLYSGAEAA